MIKLTAYYNKKAEIVEAGELGRILDRLETLQYINRSGWTYKLEPLQEG